jgi:hypothetical protein
MKEKRSVESEPPGLMLTAAFALLRASAEERHKSSASKGYASDNPNYTLVWRQSNEW